MAFQEKGALFKETAMDGLLGPKTLLIRTQTERLSHPKRSPKQGWEFDWSTAGFVGGFKPPNTDLKERRFELFSQESTQGSTRPEGVVRMLLRLFSYNISYMRLEHAPEFSKTVTVYLCFGGDPGGEQLVDVDNQTGGDKVDTIYFYDLKSMTDPVEAVREVAHEYGHAVLPPLGGDYTAPEAWANGYLGEKLYLSYLARAREAKEKDPARLYAADTLGATAPALRAWVVKNVDPLVADALTNGPRPALLARKDKAGMDAAFGLILATAQLYNPYVMCRALYANGADPKTFPEAAATAAAEPRQITLSIPPALRSKPIWIPIGPDRKKNVVQGATEMGPRKDGWVRIQPGRTDVIVRNYPD